MVWLHIEDIRLGFPEFFDGLIGCLEAQCLQLLGKVVSDQPVADMAARSEEHTSELQSLMRISYAVFCLKKKTMMNITYDTYNEIHIKNNLCTRNRKKNTHTSKTK